MNLDFDTMKGFIFTLAMVLLANTASAQFASGISSSNIHDNRMDRGAKFGVRAGLDIVDFSGGTGDYDSRTSFHVGVVADIPLLYFYGGAMRQGIFIQTGLYARSKGAKCTVKSNGMNIEQTVNPLYLQVPLFVSYHCDINRLLKLQVNFGPFFAYGVGGKNKLQVKNGEESYSSSTDFFDENNEFRRMDYGLAIGAGVTFLKHYYVGLSFDFGLCGIQHIKYANDKNLKTRDISLSLGYNF